jgi:hypothetical protein
VDTFALICFLVLGAIIGFLVLVYLVSNKKITGSYEKPAKALVSTVSTVFFVGAAGAILAGLYEVADKDGWFPHSRTMSVWMPHDWLVGEFKTCVLTGDKKVSPSLSCGDQGVSSHDMNVEFRGALDSLEAGKESKWNCQRRVESISCKAE